MEEPTFLVEWNRFGNIQNINGMKKKLTGL